MKQAIPFNFAGGLDQKTDPFQIPSGKFLSLKNTIFNKSGLLQKRNGYSSLPSLSDSSSTYLTTFNGALTAIGTKIQVLSESTNQWANKGSIYPCQLSTLPVVRSNTNQSQADTAVTSNGVVCTVYTDQDPTNLSNPIYKYVVYDKNTGQNILAPTQITQADPTYGTPKVFVLNNLFVIIFTNKVSSTYHLKYFTINSIDTTVVTSPVDISTSYTPSTTLNFDAAVLNQNLYIAWNGSASSGIKVAYLNVSLIALGTVSSSINPDASHVATLMSVCVDTVNQAIWVSYFDSGTSNGYTLAVNSNLVVLSAAALVISSKSALNLTSSANAGINSIFYEVSNNYSYDSTIPTHFINTVTRTQPGVTGATTTILRSVGLASKSFFLGSSIYMLVAYSSSFQPSYFLINSTGSIVAKLAYSNGGGYLVTGLPDVTVIGSEAIINYLIKDSISAVNKNTNVPSGTQVSGIYSQTGINLATFTIGGQIVSSEIGNNLNITGGITWGYDGYANYENNFFVWPDNVEVSTNASAVTPTGTTTSGSSIITAVSSMAGVGIGASISGTNIPANQVVVSFTSNTITFGPLTATGSGSGITLTVTGKIDVAQKYFYQATYEWSDNQGNMFRSAPSIPVSVTTTGTTSTNAINVPYLRLTYKTSNPVKIVLYRWSAAQQIYYQVTSLTYPVINSISSDSVTIYDSLSDSSIIGNNILYTNGGVVENISPPSFSSVFLFDDRLFGIDSGDKNLLWFSKQVIENTPVEMSDLFTFYVAPNIGAQGASGPLRYGAPMDDKAILFKDTSIQYFNGAGPDNTGANNQYSQPILVTSSVGSSNQASVIFMPSGLMFEFQSESGNQIWLLGRNLSTQYIGAPVEDLTKNATVQSAVNIPGANQVRFTLSSGITLIYDYYFNQWGTFVNVPAVSSTIYNGLHSYINTFGQAFQESPGSYLDGSNPVLISFKTGWLNFAGLRGYERIHEFSFLGTYLSPHTLNIQVAYDYGFPEHQSVYSPNNFVPAWGSDSLWGGSNPWGGIGNIESFRVFAKRQKCKAFQIIVQEIFDASFGTVAGAGLSLSGINFVMTFKKGYSPVAGKNSVG